MAGIVDQIPTTLITEGNIRYYEMFTSKLYNLSDINSVPHAVTPQQAAKYIFNFHGLLEEVIGKSLTFEEKFILTKLNGYDSSSDYDGKKLSVDILDVTGTVIK